MSAAPAPALDPEARASLADWLAVIAGMLGCLMAMMDISIVNSSLPTIQGEIGATPAEATWVGTGYLVAEIVVIPLTAWLQRMLGMRSLLLAAAALFTLFSVVCGLSGSLTMLVAGRIGQGLCGGVLIPTAMTLVAIRLPAGQQALGLAVTGMAALLGPVIGPVVGGWLTENYSWHYAFFLNVPVCAVQAAMLTVAIKGTPRDWSELRDADWLGVAGMIVGLGAATTLLEEGHREQWFQSPSIWRLAAVSLTGFAMIAVGQFGAKRPVVRLSLLANPALTSAATLLGGLGMLLYTAIFITPQFLVAIAGYTALQAGFLMFVTGLVAIPVAFSYALIAGRIDVRVIVAVALVAAALADYMMSGMTVLSAGPDFLLAQFFLGFGVTLTSMPLQQAVISSVPPEDAAEANSIASVTRNLGGSIGLAGLASFQEQRWDLHRWQIHSALAANDSALQDAMAQGGGMFGGGPEGAEAALRMLDGEVLRQALVMSFNDVYLAFAVIGLALLPLVLLLRPAEDGAAAAGGFH